MKTIEQRMAAIEKMNSEMYACIRELHAFILLGKTPPPPGRADYDRAIDALARGNRKPWELYRSRGGEILGEDEDNSGASARRPGQNQIGCASP